MTGCARRVTIAAEFFIEKKKATQLNPGRIGHWSGIKPGNASGCQRCPELLIQAGSRGGIIPNLARRRMSVPGGIPDIWW